MLTMIFSFCYYATFVIVPVVAFLLINDDENFHSKGGFLYLVKLYFGKRAIRKASKKVKIPTTYEEMERCESPKSTTGETKSEALSFSAVDQEGNQLSIKITLRSDHMSESTICLRLGENIYVSPDDGYVTRKYIPGNQWKCQGLKVEILEPFKRCRIIFNGFLKNVAAKSDGAIEHISIRLTFNCCSKPNFSLLDDDPSLLAKCLAKTTWRDGHWLKLLGDQKRILQFGALKGSILIDNVPEKKLNMACVKTKVNGSAEVEALKTHLTLFAATENGYLLLLGVKSLKNGCQELKYGHVLTHNGTVHAVKNCDLDLTKTERSISDKITIHVEIPKKMFKVVLTINKTSGVETIYDSFKGFKSNNLSSECTVNHHRGFAVLDNWTAYQGNGLKRPRPILRETKLENIPDIFVTPIGSEESKILELTGGKGNALALMKSMENKEIIIPDGFIVTTAAFNKQIEYNFNLRKSVALLEDIALEREKGDMKNACEVMVELFQNHTITSTVAQSIIDELIKFRRKHDEKVIPYLRWAVRSSGMGEDSEEFSAAGQNETFLGSQTDKDVLAKICKCWSSLYSYQSVIYRKQHGLPIRATMAVVVQQMVPAESSGVLFTCHPTNCDPSKMVITSNFGLGETVVSGESEPDTITLSKTYDGKVSIDSVLLGSKIHSLVMGRYGIHKQTGDENSSLLSLFKDQALLLGRVGVILEEAFGGPRDIEWAFFKGQLYILQSRPVTTLSQWTDDELTHEFDSAHVSDDTYYSRANIGEVSPFAMTALSYTSMMETIEKGIQTLMFRKYDPYVPIPFRYSHHFCFIELLGGFYSRPMKEIGMSNRMVDLAVFGRPVLTEEINKKAIARYGAHPDIPLIYQLFIIFQSKKSCVNEIIKLEKNLQIPIAEKDNIIEIYDKINKALVQMIEINHQHCFVTGLSIFCQSFVIKQLTKKQKEIKVENYSDLALILSSCGDVISADVPARLQQIAATIRRYNLAEEFQKISPEKGVKWLQANCKEAHDLLSDFLDVHGHRLLGEMEISLDTWAMDPSAVIKMLQINSQFSATLDKKEILTPEDLVKKLQSPMSPLTKTIIRLVIKKYRSAVGFREISKSTLIKAANKFRIAYKELGRRMAKEGVIPKEELIFHLTHYEIWQILHKRNLGLISKALRRQRLYPTWNNLKFPEVILGIPMPENASEEDLDISGNVICTGTPVSNGESKARAVVITSLDDVHLLKEGDVLITKSTDIGWSPYFPILSGVVTELGGLVSHGAVVAREYGLPCIVGAQNATRMFKTGDKVHISGSGGWIKLLSR